MLSDLDAEWELVFRVQEDGRRVGRLPSGKVVLVDLSERDRVQDGDVWRVRVEERGAYGIAHLVEFVEGEAEQEFAPRRVGAREVVDEERLYNEEEAPPGRDVDQGSEAWIGNPEEVVRPGEHAAVFVDGTVAAAAWREADVQIDYARLLTWARGSGVMHGGYFYDVDRRHEGDQQRFLDFLAHNGFITHLRAPRRDGRDHASVATDLAVDALSSCRAWDVAWIVANDPDLARVVDVLRARGKRVYVLFTDGGISSRLAAVANKPLFCIEDHADALEREW